MPSNNRKLQTLNDRSLRLLDEAARELHYRDERLESAIRKHIRETLDAKIAAIMADVPTDDHPLWEEIQYDIDEEGRQQAEYDRLYR